MKNVILIGLSAGVQVALGAAPAKPEINNVSFTTLTNAS